MSSTELNSLDLNNLPPDYYIRDVTTDASSSPAGGGYSKKKSGGARVEKEEAGKVYECRFCSLKFCKSQALGGHMNRHRQERETETLNKARQLVFNNDLASPPPPHLSYISSGQAVHPHGGLHQPSSINTDDTAMPFRSIYPTASRMFSSIPPPPPPMLGYPAASSPNNYYVGNVVSNSCYGPPGSGSYYTCIGAPVSHSGGGGVGRGGDQEEGRNWGRR